MKPTIEKRITEFEIETNASRDKAILESLLAVQAKSEYGTPCFARIIFKAGAIATLAVIVVVSSVLFWKTKEKNGTLSPVGNGITKTAATSSPSELITVISLNKAYYRGGMDAVDKQFEKAEKTQSRPHESVTMDQLLCELLDDC